VYAGVGKSRDEIAYALKSDILMFNVESGQELRLVSEVASGMGLKARVAIRVNPDVDPHTHPYISTGLKKSKFGIDIASALDEYEAAHALPSLEVVGIHQHIGSQITDIRPFVDALSGTGGQSQDHFFPSAWALWAISKSLAATAVPYPARFIRDTVRS
jgi:diaminopimelate decarboxylase